MAGVLQHLRSSTLNKRPNPASMVDGQVAINYASGSPGMFFKNSNGDLVKVGPVHVGSTAPNVSPASGGTAGNSIGEQWLDTAGGTYVFKIWDGAAWRSEAGEFVNTTGDTMTGSLTMGTSADIIFEGSVDDGFETTLTVANPTADRTITLPNVTGTVVTTGDSGTVTSTMIADGTIVNADVNAGAAIAGTKISPDFGSQTVQTTGIFSHALGTAAAPTVTFTGDTNTGIYSPGADQVAISTNGAGRLFVDSSGNVGVGITPTTRFNIYQAGSTQAALVETNQSASVINFKSTGQSSGQPQVGCAASDMILNTNGSERLRITSAGLVGVGTSNPQSLLHISTGNTGLCRFIIGGTGGNSARSSSIIKDTENTFDLTIRASDNPNSSAGNIIFDDGVSERLRITSAGRVGVGTTSPGALFDLAASNDGATGATANNTLRFTDLDTNTAADQPIGKIEWYSADTSSPGARAVSYILSAAAGTNSGGDIRFGVSANAGTASEAARIDSSGRLLVGTSTARSQQGVTTSLQVEGVSYNGLSLVANSTAGQNCPLILMGKSKGNAIGSSTAVANGDRLAGLFFQGADGTDIESSAGSIECFVDGTPGANDMPGRLVFSTTADGASSPTERMRITNAGLTCIGITSPIFDARLSIEESSTNAVAWARNTSASTGAQVIRANISSANDNTSGRLFSGQAGTTDRIIIYGNGNVVNTNNSYGALSDIKLKENIVDANSQWDDLKALQVRNYNFKEGQTHTQIGLVAQEVELVSPGLVTESRDRDEEGNDLGTVTKSVNYSVLYMKAVKALQEAMERIETLEAKVAALEAQ